MTGIIKVDDLKDAGGNSIISSNGSGTFTYTFNAGSIAQAALAADIINGSKLADDAVDSEHYTDGSIDNAHIADDAIDSEHYADGSIDNAHIADDAIDSEHYADGSIDTAHLAALQVTGAKLNTDVISAQTALTAEPADTDEFMVSDAGVLKRIDYSLIKSGGLTGAHTWRLTTSFSSINNDYLTTNLEQNDSTGNGIIGSAMTESSGVFTFPSTGYWYIIFNPMFLNTATAANRFYSGLIYITTDNSSYSEVGDAMAHTGSGVANTYQSSICSYLLDVTATANCKVKFRVKTALDDSDNLLYGNSSSQSTSMTFLRLGDT